MASPVKPDDFKNAIADPSEDLCGKFLDVILKLPVVVWRFIAWMIDTDGNATVAFKTNVNFVKTGDLIFSASPAPATSDRLLCAGQEVSKTTYVDLFNVIGDTWGVALDAGNFKLPDYRDKFPMGCGAGGTAALAQAGGVASVKLTKDQIPALDVELYITRYVQDPAGAENGIAASDFYGHGSANKKTDSGVTVDDVATCNAHNNLPPYLACFIYIKT